MAVGESVAIQPNGKIVIGRAETPKLAWLATTPTGRLDTSLAVMDRKMPIVDYRNLCESMAIQSDGKNSVAGSEELYDPGM